MLHILWIAFFLLGQTSQSDVCGDTLLLPGLDENLAVALYWYDMSEHAATTFVRFPSGYGNHISWSPDRRHVVYVHEEVDQEPDDLFLVDCLAERPLRLASHGILSFPVWSPDGQQIAYLRYTYRRRGDELFSHSAIHIIRLDGTGEQVVYEAAKGLRVVGWTAQGILFIEDNNLYLLEGDSPVLLTGIENRAIVNAAIAPDGTRAALQIYDQIEGNSYIALLDFDTLTLTAVQSYGTGIPGQMLWSPDGSQLAFSAQDERDQFRLYLWQNNTLTEIGDSWGESMYLREWTPDGTALVVEFSAPVLFLMQPSGDMEMLPF